MAQRTDRESPQQEQAPSPQYVNTGKAKRKREMESTVTPRKGAEPEVHKYIREDM